MKSETQLSPALLRAKPPGTWHLLVDLSLLRPGGENGGIKQFIFGYIHWLARTEGDRLHITFLTWSCSHADVRALARPGDNLICVRIEHPKDAEIVGDWRTGESICINPPPTLALDLGADLVYSPQGSPEFFCPGIPSIATIVDLLHRDYPMTLPDSDVAYREQVFSELVSRTDAFQCISDFTAGQLRRHYDISSERIFRTYIAVQERFECEGASVDRGASRPYFLFPANAWPHKNHQTLLLSYRLYRHIVGERAWDLKLTGHDSVAMREVLATADALGLSDCVTYHGHLLDSEFQALWCGAGALVFPSLHEGFGIPIIEAMHLGIPVLCSPETSLPEVAGDAALIVNCRKPTLLAAGLERITLDTSLRDQLVARGHERAKAFSIAREGHAFLEECRRLRSVPSRCWDRGIHPDGWTEPFVCVGIPPEMVHPVIEIDIAGMPANRRVRAYRGRSPVGAWNIAPSQNVKLQFALLSSTGPLVLEIPNAEKLSTNDHRTHGILLSRLSIKDPSTNFSVQIFPR